MAGLVSSVMDVEIDRIDPPAEKHRGWIDPVGVQELAESIRSVGQLEPCLVRPVGDRFEVVFGHRRYLALKLIGASVMKCIVAELSDEEVFERRAVENIQRVDLSVMEKAQVFREWMDKFGLSVDGVAARCGVSPATVRNHLRLLEIDERFWPAISKKEISMGAVLVLLEIEDKATFEYYLEAGIENGITMQVARSWVDSYRKSLVGVRPWEGGGEGGAGVAVDPTPIYVTCFCCHAPVEQGRVSYQPLCKSCFERVRGALSGGD